MVLVSKKRFRFLKRYSPAAYIILYPLTIVTPRNLQPEYLSKQPPLYFILPNYLLCLPSILSHPSQNGLIKSYIHRGHSPRIPQSHIHGRPRAIQSSLKRSQSLLQIIHPRRTLQSKPERSGADTPLASTCCRNPRDRSRRFRRCQASHTTRSFSPLCYPGPILSCGTGWSK
jgi:hypothetical protein